MLAETPQAMMPIALAPAGRWPAAFRAAPPMQFRIADVAYLFALLATSVAAFGFGCGVLTAIVAAIFWLSVFKQPRPTFIEWLVVVGVILVLLALLLPAFDVAREQSRVNACRAQLSNLSKGIIRAADNGGPIPQAIVRDENGQPLHSWRVAILPFIDYQSTFAKYDWTQPWDGSNNLGLGGTVDLFVCYSDVHVGLVADPTNYFAVLGAQTAWPEDRGLTMGEITDGPENTVLLLEAHGLDVAWMEPRDLSLDEATALLTGRDLDRLAHHRYDNPGYFYLKPPLTSRGVHAVFADGKVRFLPAPLPEKMAKALLTANAGDHVDWEEFERLTAPQLDYAKIYATIAFAVVALWPARRAFRRRSVLAPGSSSRGERRVSPPV